MAHIFYFAYGSNMLETRLRSRVSSAVRIGRAVLSGYRLDFAKRSIDQSGKADVVRHEECFVNGVLFRFDSSQKNELDRHEGNDYTAVDLMVSTESGEQQAMVYIAKPNKRDVSLLPYDWYLALIVAGARSNELSASYRALLEATAFIVDDDEGRKSRADALAALEQAKMSYVLDELRSQTAVSEKQRVKSP